MLSFFRSVKNQYFIQTQRTDEWQTETLIVINFRTKCVQKMCHGFMIFGYQYSTSQHHAVYWELKSKCFSSGYRSGRELRSPRAFLSTVIIPAQGNRYKGAGHLIRPLLVSPCSLLDRLATAAPNCTQGFSTSVRPLALDNLSLNYFWFILYYSVLSYIPMLYLVN